MPCRENVSTGPRYLTVLPFNPSHGVVARARSEATNSQATQPASTSTNVRAQGRVLMLAPSSLIGERKTLASTEDTRAAEDCQPASEGRAARVRPAPGWRTRRVEGPPIAPIRLVALVALGRSHRPPPGEPSRPPAAPASGARSRGMA